jgi:hypothetical protein
VISHSGREASWLTLSNAIQAGLPIHQAVFERIIMAMSSFGSLEHFSIDTTIESKKLDQLVYALGFVWSDGDPDRWTDFYENRSLVESALSENFFVGGKYIFPFRHSIVSVSRP